jgi:hypothetical protein
LRCVSWRLVEASGYGRDGCFGMERRTRSRRFKVARTVSKIQSMVLELHVPSERGERQSVCTAHLLPGSVTDDLQVPPSFSTWSIFMMCCPQFAHKCISNLNERLLFACTTPQSHHSFHLPSHSLELFPGATLISPPPFSLARSTPLLFHPNSTH